MQLSQMSMGGGKEGGLREGRRMTRMKISKSLGSSAQGNNILF